MERVPVETVADFIVREMHEYGDPISNLKLQKLLYYVQAWAMAKFDQPIFSDRIKAWVHGPVVPAIYHRYKEAGWQPLPEPDGEAGDLPEVWKDHITAVLDTYGPLTAMHLERLTHQESPWIEARGDLEPEAPSDAEISLDSMRDFYRRMADHGQES